MFHLMVLLFEEMIILFAIANKEVTLISWTNYDRLKKLRIFGRLCHCLTMFICQTLLPFVDNVQHAHDLDLLSYEHGRCLVKWKLILDFIFFYYMLNLLCETTLPVHVSSQLIKWWIECQSHKELYKCLLSTKLSQFNLI